MFFLTFKNDGSNLSQAINSIPFLFRLQFSVVKNRNSISQVIIVIILLFFIGMKIQFAVADWLYIFIAYIIV